MTKKQKRRVLMLAAEIISRGNTGASCYAIKRASLQIASVYPYRLQREYSSEGILRKALAMWRERTGR